MRNNDKQSRLDTIQIYDRTFEKSKYNKIMIVSLIATFVVGVAFQLTDNPNFSDGAGLFPELVKFLSSIFWPPFVLIPVVFALYIVPNVILSMKINKYEENKLNDVSTYIEQMLYSFKKNSKILNALIDTLSVFPEGEMKDTIETAIEYIKTGVAKDNIYAEALQVIEDKYSCRRIRSLHRYLVKVEGVGGEFSMGVQALLNDRRLWVERLDEFKKEKGAIIKDILISTVFSTVIIIITLYMLPKDYSTATHIITRCCTLAYLLLTMLNIKATYTRTVLYVNDIEDKEHEKYMAKKLKKYRSYDLKKEKKKALKVVLVFIIMGTIASVTMALMNNTKMIGAVIALCVGGSVFAYFIQPSMKYSSMRKSLVNEIEKVYPDWLLELSLLLQTKNLHVALEETIKTAPLVIKKELKVLAEEIAKNPTSMEPYAKFLNDIPVPGIHSSMKLLYSIGESGASDEINQISELIKRNSALMNKAEIRKNNERLSKVFLMKFVPMGLSAVKMVADMFVFLLVFMGTAMQI